MDTDLLNGGGGVLGGGGENGGFDVAHLACHAPAHPNNGRGKVNEAEIRA